MRFLARFDDPTASKALIAALSHRDIEVVEAATGLLQQTALTNYDALVELLESANPTVVAAALAILAGARQTHAADAIATLQDDQRRPGQGAPAIGQRARAALAQLAPSVMTGDGSLDQPSGAVNGSAAEFSAAEKIRRTLDVLRDDDWGRTQKAAKFLRKFARHMRGSDNAAIRQLLCAALDDENWSVRWAAAEALAMLRDDAAIPPLQTR